MRALKQNKTGIDFTRFYVTTQAHEGIETIKNSGGFQIWYVTTQAHEGIETKMNNLPSDSKEVTTQAHEGIETICKVTLRESDM